MSPSDVQSSILSGDLRRAASSLVVSYGSDVLATCMAMVRDRSAAEDVTQEVFADAIRALSTFRGEASPRTWLLSIARNRCIDYLRARRRDPWGGATDDGSSDPDVHADQAALDGDWFAERSAVLSALDALAEGDRAFIVLRFKNGLEYDELATAFGLREGTVRMRVSRALARMRGVLEADERGAPPAAGPVVASRGRAAVGARPPPPPAGFGPPPAVAAAPVQPGAYGAAPVARGPWWARLTAWAGLGSAAGPPPPLPPRPIGALGVALAAFEPAILSDALAARLVEMVERVPGAAP